MSRALFAGASLVNMATAVYSMYSDIVGFTSLCSESQPLEVVTLREYNIFCSALRMLFAVNGMFTAFDNVINAHRAYVSLDANSRRNYKQKKYYRKSKQSVRTLSSLLVWCQK